MNINIDQDPPLMRLPTEIRNMIFRHLLVAKHTMKEPSMTTEEVSLYKSKFLSLFADIDIS